MKYCFAKKGYYVATGKIKKISGGFRNYEICKTLDHALRIYYKCKVKYRQIDVREKGKIPYALRWGRK